MKRINPKGLGLALFTGLFVALSLQSTIDSIGVPGNHVGLHRQRRVALTDNLKIVAWAPTGTRAGVGFNVQSDDQSALWVRVNADVPDRGVYVVLGGIRLASMTSRKNPDVITSIVPPGVYRKPRKFSLHVEAESNGKVVRSNTVYFKVTK